jgi:GTPase SAR1 family protein
LTELTSIKYLVVGAVACGKTAFGNNTIPKVRTKDLFKIV